MNIKKVNIREEGLNVFFGPLEAKIMELLWKKGEYSAKEMQFVLSEENPISFNAVMTVMNRLVEKGYLKKEKKGTGRDRVSVFSPVQEKEQFISDQTKTITHGLVSEFGEYVVTHMLDALEQADPELIAKLEEKLADFKRRPST
ncbi:BlaI/MecI/CopY family transcriptional regulator [Paenibacillus antri]|uniref:BlaI/MecI/CopY family transcriptional regulator n=1 Tax=Paenibacillus antri TaxID=2582848 RepID=A0A5R9G7F5_9BACL|nr:BlaI/MecI/CopY family transcriptional regulator [Paenibacillus antri]TLS50020.1 BlaI/MecI/CopY family transcriptional regulator [Paenibacillus antri]